MLTNGVVDALWGRLIFCPSILDIVMESEGRFASVFKARAWLKKTCKSKVFVTWQLLNTLSGFKNSTKILYSKRRFERLKKHCWMRDSI